MAQIYEYILKINDLASSKMKSFSHASQLSVGKVMHNMDSLHRTLGKTVTPINALRDQINAVSKRRDLSVNTTDIRKANGEIRKLEKELNKLENLPPRGFFSGLSRAKSQLGGLGKMAVASFGAAGVASIAQDIVKLGSDLEQSKVSFTVLTGSAEKANALISSARTMSIKTPFESSDLLNAAQMMLNFGIAQEDVMGHMQRLGDVSGGNKEKFQGLTLAFSQMQSTGRLMGQDLLQMINAGFNPLQEISKRTGKTLAELKTEMEAGGISADMVTQAFIDATGAGGRFNGMLDKQSNTLAGKWSTLVGGMKEKLADSGLKINEYLKKAVAVGISAMENMQPITDAMGRIWNAFSIVFKQIWNSISPIINLFTKTKEQGNGVASTMQTIGAVLEYISYPLQVLGSMAAWVIEKFDWLIIGIGAITAAQWLWNIAMNANPIGLVIGGFAILVGTVQYAWNKFEGFRKVMYGVWEVLKNYLKTIGHVFTAMYKLVTLDFKGAFESVKNAFNQGKEFGTAWEKGKQKGADSFAKSKKTSGVKPQPTGNNAPPIPTFPLGAGGGSDALGMDNAPVNAGGSSSPELGGTKNITISIGKVGADTITLHTQNAQEGISQIKEQFLDMWLSVLNGSQKLAPQ